MHISKKCSVAIHCLIFIHEYGDKVKVTSDLVSKSTGISAVTIRNIFSSLKKEGILSIKNGTGGALIQCPLEDISLYRICQALEPDFLSHLIGIHDSPSSLCPVGKNIHAVLDMSYDIIRNDLKKSLETITMKKVISDYEKMNQ